MRLLLHEDMPLRTSRVLGDFADDFVLGHALGDLTQAPFPARRLSDTRFFVADHVFDGTAAFVDGAKTLSFEFRFESDGQGRTWTIVTLGAPVPKESTVWVAGRGNRNPRTGELIENPADVLDYICRLAGRTDNWQALRDETSTLGIKIAGRVATVKSIRATITEVCQSIGAIWSVGMARIYPADAITGHVMVLEKSSAELARPSTSLDDTFDVLRLGYDYSEGRQKAQRFIELKAQPQRFGGVPKEVTYPWIRTAANAETIGRRVLGRGAGERYAVPFTSRKRIRPGQWCTLKDNPRWTVSDADPTVMVRAVTIDEETGATDVTVAEAILSVPVIKVTGHTIALPDAAEASIEVVTVNGVTTITALTLDGQPIKGARISLDNGPAHTTNDRGQAFFRVKPGTHKALIEAPDKDPVQIDIVTGDVV